MNKVFVVVLLFALLTTSVNAKEHKGKISGFYINSSQTVLVKFDTPPSDCGDGNWPYQFSMDNAVAKEWVSMLLMARASNQEIRIGYTSTTEEECSIVYFYFYD